MAKKSQILGHAWSFAGLWNQALHSFPERPLQKRSHIWASELGLAYVDRYLKMHAFPYSNPPNDRSRRKFVAGHIWEWIISLVLTMAGVLKERQLRGEVELPGLLKVSGKLDFIAGGPVDWEKARYEIKRVQELFSICLDNMPPFILYALEHVVVSMEKYYGDKPLKEIILETKAVSSYMSEKIEKTGKPVPHNVLQCVHYLIANKMDEAKLNYVCKDDSIMHEFGIFNTKEMLKLYREDVATMTDYYNASNHKNPLKTLPPKEPEVLFAAGVYRFEKNFNVEYSPYLEFLYGYKTPEDFRMVWQRKISNWNRVFRRCVKGENITDKNKEVMKEVKPIFAEWDKYVYKARSEGAFLKPEEIEEFE